VGGSADGSVGTRFEVDRDLEHPSGEAPVSALYAWDTGDLQAHAMGEAVAAFEWHGGWDAHE